MKKYIKTIFFFTLSFMIVSISFLAAEKYPKRIEPKNPSILKTQYMTTPQKNEIVRVELEVLDDTTKDHHDIIDLEFNDKQIDLLKAGAQGRRARKYFQLKPGKYLLKWRVSKSSYAPPRSTTYKKIINLKKDDKFVHILVIGDQVEVTSS